MFPSVKFLLKTYHIFEVVACSNFDFIFTGHNGSVQCDPSSVQKCPKFQNPFKDIFFNKKFKKKSECCDGQAAFIA